MSDQKEIGQNETNEVMESWLVQKSFVKSEPNVPQFFDVLGFGRAMLFPIEKAKALDVIVETVSYAQCPACRIRMTKSASTALTVDHY